MDGSGSWNVSLENDERRCPFFFAPSIFIFSLKESAFHPNRKKKPHRDHG
jgi:hypothetical protein